MVTPLESSIVRIYSSNGRVIGAGFLVSRNHILTCAHVVASALGIATTTPEMPTTGVSLDFPRVVPGEKLTAKVVFWRPQHPNPSTLEEFEEDIAALELESSPPKAAQPVRLVTSEDLWEHRFRVLGFPEGKSNGVWASGVLREGVASGWVHIEDVKEAGYRLERGFSGAPVWDEELQGVAGMAVAAENSEKRLGVKAAFIIPTNRLGKALPKLNQQVIHPEIWKRAYTRTEVTVEPGAKNLGELPKTNYNYGFIVDRVNYKQLSDGSRVYSLDVFNTGYADGVIESRSKQGELIDIRGIEGIRLPSTVWEFGWKSIERLSQFAAEGYDFLDKRNSLGNSQKTEVRNIKILPGGKLKLTKLGEYALIYNQATFLTRLFCNLPILSICEKLQKKGKGSFVKSESLRSLMKENLSIPVDEASKAFLSSSWIDNHKLEELKKICQEVMMEENINSRGFSENSLVTMLRITGLEMLKLPVNATEDFAKSCNGFLQWINWERSQIIEKKQGTLFIKD